MVPVSFYSGDAPQVAGQSSTRKIPSVISVLIVRDLDTLCDQRGKTDF